MNYIGLRMNYIGLRMNYIGFFPLHEFGVAFHL